MDKNSLSSSRDGLEWTKICYLIPTTLLLASHIISNGRFCWGGWRDKGPDQMPFQNIKSFFALLGWNRMKLSSIAKNLKSMWSWRNLDKVPVKTCTTKKRSHIPNVLMIGKVYNNINFSLDDIWCLGLFHD